MQTVPKNKSTREHQFSICVWRSKIWKIKKSLKKHKKTKQTIFGDFLGKAPRRKAKQKKHIWRLFGEGPKEKTKKHKKNKKTLLGSPNAMLERFNANIWHHQWKSCKHSTVNIFVKSGSTFQHEWFNTQIDIYFWIHGIHRYPVLTHIRLGYVCFLLYAGWVLEPLCSVNTLSALQWGNLEVLPNSKKTCMVKFCGAGNHRCLIIFSLKRMRLPLGWGTRRTSPSEISSP